MSILMQRKKAIRKKLKIKKLNNINNSQKQTKMLVLKMIMEWDIHKEAQVHKTMQNTDLPYR